uniref:Amidohydrolase n=1 Tax=Candidatus Kentrum sp. TUN TaxID=2126343 RepID=A0A450ZHX7_9GAMM|nr:MAG: amidohydrolase [Candidatus Kentron sp. TUN]VFK54413.1 MAG: amidohydrolase [Candidatus Kentron sp. TUN]
MKIDIREITKAVDNIIPKIKDIRRHLHANPELSLKEYNTSEYIRKQLRDIEINVSPPLLETDVIAYLNCGDNHNNVTLRADTDALPIQESRDFAYCSKKSNIMHACGHDGHTAMLIGAAIILAKYRHQLNGSIRFVFQPGEEIVAAGRDLVGKGILNSPKPKAVLALHGWPGYPVGSIGGKHGPFLAAADIYEITITGKGGHGSRPEESVDPIMTATKIINSLYLLPSRRFRALDALVISVCKIAGGASSNVIPDRITMGGSARYLSKKVGDKLPQLFEDIIRTECDNAGATYELKYENSYIPTVNDKNIVNKCKDITKRHIGESMWIDIEEPSMGSEDFSYYIDKNPGGLFFLGMGENSPMLHTNSFDFNDDALRNGILFFVLSTIELIESMMH